MLASEKHSSLFRATILTKKKAYMTPQAFNVSDASKTINDYAILNIGNTCPSGATSTDPGTNLIKRFSL
jgi:hypothetical protein